MRKIDEDKSTNVRLKKLRELVDHVDITTEHSFNDTSFEWVVKATVVVYKDGFKKESTGLGSMSVKDPDYGWSALPYAETTSIGRAIGKLGLIEADIATDLEKESGETKLLVRKESKKTVDSDSVNDFVRSAFEKASRHASSHPAKLSPQEEPELNDSSPTIEDIQVYDSGSEQEEDFLDTKQEPKEDKPNGYTENQLNNMLAADVLALYNELIFKAHQVDVEDLPGRATKARLIEYILAFQEGKFLDVASEIVSQHMLKNIEKGLAGDIDIPSYLLSKLELIVPSVTEEGKKEVQVTYNAEAVDMVNKFLAVGRKDFPAIRVGLLDVAKSKGYDLAKMQKVFAQFEKAKLTEHSRLFDFLRDSSEDQLKLYFTELFKGE